MRCALKKAAILYAYVDAFEHQNRRPQGLEMKGVDYEQRYNRHGAWAG
jgi:hypothetical protein